jgi:hypothetical protein
VAGGLATSNNEPGFELPATAPRHRIDLACMTATRAGGTIGGSRQTLITSARQWYASIYGERSQ